MGPANRNSKGGGSGYVAPAVKIASARFNEVWAKPSMQCFDVYYSWRYHEIKIVIQILMISQVTTNKSPVYLDYSVLYNIRVQETNIFVLLQQEVPHVHSFGLLILE